MKYGAVRKFSRQLLSIFMSRKFIQLGLRKIGKFTFLKYSAEPQSNEHRLSQRLIFVINPLRPNSDLSQTSHCNIKGLSVWEVKRIENMITQVKFY